MRADGSPTPAPPPMRLTVGMLTAGRDAWNDSKPLYFILAFWYPNTPLFANCYSFVWDERKRLNLK